MPVRATVGLFCTLFKTVTKYNRHYLFVILLEGLVKVPFKEMVKVPVKEMVKVPVLEPGSKSDVHEL